MRIQKNIDPSLSWVGKSHHHDQHVAHKFRWWPGACLSLLANDPKDHSQHHDTGGRQNNHCHQSSSVHNVNITITFVVVITITIRYSPHECTPARAFPFLSLASHRFVISPKYLFQFEMVKMSLTLLFHTNYQQTNGIDCDEKYISYKNNSRR